MVNDIQNNYFYKNGKLGEWVAVYLEDAKNELSNQRENFSIPVKNKTWVESYKNVINNLIKYQLEEVGKHLYWTLSFFVL